MRVMFRTELPQQHVRSRTYTHARTHANTQTRTNPPPSRPTQPPPTHTNHVSNTELGPASHQHFQDQEGGRQRQKGLVGVQEVRVCRVCVCARARALVRSLARPLVRAHQPSARVEGAPALRARVPATVAQLLAHLARLFGCCLPYLPLLLCARLALPCHSIRPCQG